MSLNRLPSSPPPVPNRQVPAYQIPGTPEYFAEVQYRRRLDPTGRLNPLPQSPPPVSKWDQPYSQLRTGSGPPLDTVRKPTTPLASPNPLPRSPARYTPQPQTPAPYRNAAGGVNRAYTPGTYNGSTFWGGNTPTQSHAAAVESSIPTPRNIQAAAQRLPRPRVGGIPKVGAGLGNMAAGGLASAAAAIIGGAVIDKFWKSVEDGLNSLPDSQRKAVVDAWIGAAAGATGTAPYLAAAGQLLPDAGTIKGFGDALSDAIGDLANLGDAIAGGAAEGTPPPPFTGGQSNDVLYDVTFYRARVGFPQIEDVYSLYGPILNAYAQYTDITPPAYGVKHIVVGRAAPGGAIQTFEFGPIETADLNSVVTGVTRNDGQPDTGGNLPGGEAGPSSPPNVGAIADPPLAREGYTPSKPPLTLPGVNPSPIPALPEPTPENQAPPIPAVGLPAGHPLAEPSAEPEPFSPPKPAVDPEGNPTGDPAPKATPNNIPAAQPFTIPPLPLFMPAVPLGEKLKDPTTPGQFTSPVKSPPQAWTPPAPAAVSCRCNGPILAGQQQLQQSVDKANEKLDPQEPGGNGGLAGILAAIAEMRTFVGNMQQFAEKAWDSTKLQKVIDLLTLITVLHNASMVSRDIAETLGYAVSNGLSALGIKDEEGNALDVNAIVGKTVTEKIKDILGEDVYNDIRTAYLKANRILSTGSMIIWTIRSIQDSSLDLLEWVGEHTGKIGNALKRFGVVGERAYPWMSERPTSQERVRRRMQRFIDGLETADDAASSFATATSSVLEITEEVNELKQQKEQFQQAVQDVAPVLRPDNTPVATTATTAATNAQSPVLTINDTDKGVAP